MNGCRRVAEEPVDVQVPVDAGVGSFGCDVQVVRVKCISSGTGHLQIRRARDMYVFPSPGGVRRRQAAIRQFSQGRLSGKGATVNIR